MEARALEIVYGAVQALNEQIENPDERIPLAPESTLLGKDAHLDSLSLATLLLFAEQRIEDTSACASSFPTSGRSRLRRARL